MKYLSLGVLLLASAAGTAAQIPAGKGNDKVVKEPITLTGCVEAGTAPNTFMLTHVMRSDTMSMTPAPAAAPAPTTQPAPTTPPAYPPATPPATPPTEQPAPTVAPPSTQPMPTATSGTEPAAIYWLDPPDKLKGHVGHKVSVSGTLDEDVDKVKIKEKDDKVKIEAEHGTKKVEVKEGTAGAADAKAAKTGEKQDSYKIKVKTVTMISASCS